MQIKEEAFVEDLNNLLNAGEVSIYIHTHTHTHTHTHIYI